MCGGRFTRRWLPCAVGTFLCLLAFTFAIEAKLAWYGPQSSSNVQLSSTKLQLADATRMIEEKLVSPHDQQRTIVDVSLLLSISLFMIPVIQSYRYGLSGTPPLCTAIFQSPAISKRPPPRA